MEIIVRKETKQDYDTITDINKEAFGQNNEAHLVENLRNNSKFVEELSLVAEVDNQLVGHILLFPVNVIYDTKLFESLSLAPMAVLPDFQLQGIGKKLVSTGLDKARELEFKSVIVVGHKKYYPRFGFRPAREFGIQCPYDVPEEVFMAMELQPGGLENIRGMVEYPVEFDEMA